MNVAMNVSVIGGLTHSTAFTLRKFLGYMNTFINTPNRVHLAVRIYRLLNFATCERGAQNALTKMPTTHAFKTRPRNLTG